MREREREREKERERDFSERRGNPFAKYKSWNLNRRAVVLCLDQIITTNMEKESHKTDPIQITRVAPTSDSISGIARNASRFDPASVHPRREATAKLKKEMTPEI